MTHRAGPTRTPLRVGLLLGAALLSGSAATACGVFFPWQLLGNRNATLRDLPVDSFDVEAGRLVARPDPRLPPTAAGPMTVRRRPTRRRRSSAR